MEFESVTRGIQAWRRERRAWPELALLGAGVKLRRVYKGCAVDVMVLRVGYRWQGEDYFTLGDIVACLVPGYLLDRADRPGKRRVCSQSAKRFFYDALLDAVGDADGMR